MSDPITALVYHRNRRGRLRAYIARDARKTFSALWRASGIVGAGFVLAGVVMLSRERDRLLSELRESGVPVE